jgi:hypothetical protein
MRHWGDVEAMISEPAIDKRTEEKMFFGTLAPEDAPPELARVAVLLRAAGLPRTGTRSGSLVSDSEKLRQEHVVAAMAAVIAAAPEGLPAAAPGHTFLKSRTAIRPERAGGRRRGRARLVLVMAFAMMVAGASMAFAGVLPTPMQHAASVLFSKVGVHVPNGHSHEGTGSGTEPGSPSGHEKVTGSGDHGKGEDHGKHTGQQKNGNRGLHKGHEGDHGHHGDGGQQGHGGDGNNGQGTDGNGHDGGNGHGSGDGNSQGQSGGGQSGSGASGGSGDSGGTPGGGQSGGDNGHDGGGRSGHHSLEVATP